MYGFIDISEVLVMLNTWSKIEKPPKPSRNAQVIMLIEISLNWIFEINATPFVNSIIPEKNPLANDEGKLSDFSSGEVNISKISNILVLFIIDIITLNSITKPPIIRIVFIELIILLCKIAPKLLNVGGILEEEV